MRFRSLLSASLSGNMRQFYSGAVARRRQLRSVPSQAVGPRVAIERLEQRALLSGQAVTPPAASPPLPAFGPEAALEVDLPFGDFTDSLSSTSPEDYYKFTAVGGQQYIITAEALASFAGFTGLSDPTLTLYGTDGVTQLAFDDDSGPGLSAQIRWTAPANGSYYFAVRSAVAGSYGGYRLTGLMPIAFNSAPVIQDTLQRFSSSGIYDQRRSLKFTAEAGQDYRFALTEQSSIGFRGFTSSLSLVLYTPDGITKTGFSISPDLSAAVISGTGLWTAPVSGEYYLLITSSNNSLFSSDYSFSYLLEIVASPSLPVNSTISGSISSVAEADFFSFTAAAGQRFFLSTTLGSLPDSTLTLFGTDGRTTLAYSDDFNGTNASLISWTAPVAGTYYLGVKGFATNTGTYQLTVAAAAPLVIPSNTAGQISTIGEADYYAFNAVAGQLYEFTTILGTLPDSVLSLLGGDGTTVLAENDDFNGTKASQITWTAPGNGVYYLRARGFGSNAGTYQLQAGGVPTVAGGPGVDDFLVSYTAADTREVYRNGALVTTVTGNGPLNIVGDSSDNVTVAGLETSDTLSISGTQNDFNITRGLNGVRVLGPVNSVTLDGRGGDDTLSSWQFGATLRGGAGNDVLSSGGGNDALDGGANDDRYVFNATTALASDSVTDASGIDTLDFSGSSLGATVNLGTDVNQSVNSNLSLTLSSFASIENVIGSSGNDVLTGNSLDNTLNGGLGNDRYAFNTSSAQGVDSVSDSGGIDTLDFGNSNNSVTVNLGLDTSQAVNANLTLTLPGTRDLEDVIGGAGDDLLTGNDENNVLRGGLGNDTLAGGGGNDTYSFAPAGTAEIDTLVETAVGGANDRLDFSLLTTPVNVNLNNSTLATMANRTVITTASSTQFFEDVAGGSGDDSLTGNSAFNNLYGNGGNDTLNGGNGSSNNLYGGPGNDRYVFGNSTGPTAIDGVSESAGEGIDTLDFSNVSAGVTANLSLDYGLGSIPNRLVFAGTPGMSANFENLIGGAGNDALTGNFGDNVLTGNGGNDTLAGGAGNDTYVFVANSPLGSDIVTETGGVDTVSFAGTTGDVALNLGLNTLQPVNANLNLTLQNSTPQLENLIGGNGNDTLTGNSQNNVLTGGRGNDTLAGGSGSDTYVFNPSIGQGSDTIADSAGGSDLLDFSASTVSVAVDLSRTTAQPIHPNLTLTLLDASPSIENVTGGSGNDTLTGNSLNNVLTGGAGNDRYVFNTTTPLGTDTLNDSAGVDTIDFTGSTSGQTINLSQPNQQPVSTNVRLILGTSIFENAIGGSGNDTFTGNSANNNFTGGNGNDTYVFNTNTQQGSDAIFESGGVDTVTFAGSNSAVVLNLSTTTPQVVDPVNGNLTLWLGNTIPQLENLIGGNGSDTLTGNAQNNTLTGGAGNDTLAGSTGSDNYVFADPVGTETDTVIELVNGGANDRLDFSATTIGITVDLNQDATLATMAGRTVQTGTAGQAANFEHVLGGSGNDTLTGNAANNLLSGGGGNDTLRGQMGRDLLVGGTGNDDLRGGPGSDLLIGGQFMPSQDQLTVLVGRWGQSGTYASRVTAITTGSPALTSFTLADDGGAVDTLDGGPGTGDADLDLFFTSVGDTLNPAADPGEQIISI